GPGARGRARQTHPRRELRAPGGRARAARSARWWTPNAAIRRALPEVKFDAASPHSLPDPPVPLATPLPLRHGARRIARHGAGRIARDLTGNVLATKVVLDNKVTDR